MKWIYITQNTETTFAFNPFFSTLNATLAKKGQSSKAVILSTRQNIFPSPIQSFKQSQRGNKKIEKFLCVSKNIAFNQTTFV